MRSESGLGGGEGVSARGVGAAEMALQLLGKFLDYFQRNIDQVPPLKRLTKKTSEELYLD